MLFFDLANLFEKLEKNSKRIEKILILRDLYFNYKSETPKVFDLISNNFLFVYIICFLKNIFYFFILKYEKLIKKITFFYCCIPFNYSSY